MKQLTEKTFYVMDSNEFDALVREFYELPAERYRFIESEEMNNDTDKVFMKVKKDQLNEWDAEKLRVFKYTYGKSEGMWITWTLFTDMCNNDFIPEGNYLIQVSW